MVLFGAGALLISLASFAVLLMAWTGAMESTVTGDLVFAVLGILAAFIGVAVLIASRKAPTS